MRINSYHKLFSFALILLSVLSFFIGFIYGENSAGAGAYGGDWDIGWKNIQIILKIPKETSKKIIGNIRENYGKKF